MHLLRNVAYLDGLGHAISMHACTLHVKRRRWPDSWFSPEDPESQRSPSAPTQPHRHNRTNHQAPDHDDADHPIHVGRQCLVELGGDGVGDLQAREFLGLDCPPSAATRRATASPTASPRTASQIPRATRSHATTARAPADLRSSDAYLRERIQTQPLPSLPRMSRHIDFTSVAATRSRATDLSLHKNTGPASSSS